MTNSYNIGWISYLFYTLLETKFTLTSAVLNDK